MELKLFGKKITIQNANTKALPAISNDSAWQSYLRGKGYDITPMNALKVSAVIRCVDIIAKTMASMPLDIFRRKGDSREKADNHLLWPLLHVLPNPHTTAYDFWHMYICNLLLTPFAVARVFRDTAGRITALYNIPTAQCSKIYVNEENGERYFYVTDDFGHVEILRDGDYMYTPGMRLNDDIDTLDPMYIAANVLGLTMSLNGFAEDFFANGTNLGGWIELPEALSDTAYERFKESWYSSYTGVVNQHKVAFLEEGVKFHEAGREASDSQLLESRQFAVTEVCRIFGVPPHLVFDLSHATFSNIEQQNMEFVQTGLLPISVRLEQTIYKDLLTERDRRDCFAKFNLNGLLRGDTATRTAYYNSMRQNGIMNADEIRALEEMNSIPDGLGKIYLVNGNSIPLSAVPQNLPRGAKRNE